MAGLLAAMSAVFPSPLPADGPGVEDIKKGVVKITARVEGQQARVGTGFIVSAEEDAAYIVTASHVIGNDPQPEVEFFTKPHQTFKAKVIATEGASDNGLAALLVQMKVPKGTLALGVDAATRLSGGEAVSSIGFPRRREAWAVTSGTISGIKNRHITVQAPIEEGNSGGPLLLNGRVVGVVTQSSGSFGQAEPAATVKLFLDSSRVPMEEVQAAAHGARPAPEPEEDGIADEPAPPPRKSVKGALDLTGTWFVPGEPLNEFHFSQVGHKLTMSMVTTIPSLGSQAMAYAEGEIVGRHVELVYINAQYAGTIILDVADDGVSMQGTVNVGAVPVPMTLKKRGH